MQTYLAGRLRNTPLPYTQGLLPLFEAVVNSIHSVDGRPSGSPRPEGKIEIEILRIPQGSLPLEEERARRGPPALEQIIGFTVTDNGVGFNDENLKSFRTLDTDLKAALGCRGVGRLTWLKAFDRVEILSDFTNGTDEFHRREFSFTATEGVSEPKEMSAPQNDLPSTSVKLIGFSKEYSARTLKSARTIANSLLEHCLWYFVRPGGAPTIRIKDDDEAILLDEVYEEYMLSAAERAELKLKKHDFELTHIKLKAGSGKQHFIAWCAAGRLVEEENLGGKLPGLYGKLRQGDTEFVYACYVTSPFLDSRVRPERTGFDAPEISDDLFSRDDLSLKDIKSAVIGSIGNYLSGFLEQNQMESANRVAKFVEYKSPRYRPILKRISKEKLDVAPDITDRDLELHLHKQLMEIEGSLIAEGQELMNFGFGETIEQYQQRLEAYLEKVADIKKSDLANYVFHRKIVLDILQKSIQRNADGRYSKEELIHELIIPMRRTSDEITADKTNLWLIDERLAFHNFLASDKPLSSLPITTSSETKEPDIVALNVFDAPLLVSEGDKLPLATVTVIEIKRPMRDDARSGEDKNAMEQALGYLERIRKGETTTQKGRQIPVSNDIPGYCYVLCDITPTVQRQCKLLNLRITADKMGYFGYNDNYNAYIEVISFDRLINAASERNRVFFDKLGLPT